MIIQAGARIKSKGSTKGLSCLYLMISLPRDTWIRLVGWLVIGLAICFGFGMRKSRLRHPDEPRPL